MAVRCDTLNRTISEWGIVEGEPMLNYAKRFEREVLGQLLYPRRNSLSASYFGAVCLFRYDNTHTKYRMTTTI